MPALTNRPTLVSIRTLPIGDITTLLLLETAR